MEPKRILPLLAVSAMAMHRTKLLTPPRNRFAFFSMVFLMFFNGMAWGQTTITIDIASTGITSNSYDNGAERTWTQGGVDFGAKAVLKASGTNAGTIQFQASNGVIYNTTAIPGIIKTIKVTKTDSNGFTLYGGNSGRMVNSTAADYTVTGTSEGTFTDTSWTSADLTSKNYTYFALKKGSNASYVSSIEITYVTSAPSAPNLSNESYTGTVGAAFSETPSNTGGTATSWAVVSGSLPAGLSLNASTGEISGTPTVAGNNTVDIKATNATGDDTATYDFTINTATGGACFSENFASITNGDNTTTGGSSIAWNGNVNFPTVNTAYQAGGAVKLGTGSLTGYIQSKNLDGVSGDITVKIMVKGWTTVEGNLKISIDGQSQTLSYTAKMADPFQEVTANFTGVSAGANLKIETTAKRAFIDNVVIECGFTAYYFRTRQNGNWTSTSSWESSVDGISWLNSSTYPNENAISVDIRNGHSITINSTGIKIKNTSVSGTLIAENSDYEIVGTENQLVIKAGGVYELKGSSKPTTSSSGTALVITGGIFKVISFSESKDFVSNYLEVGNSKNKFRFQNQSIFSWEAGGGYTLGSTGFAEFFWVENPGDLVIYRFQNSFSGTAYGSGTNNLFHAVLEINGTKTMDLAGNGTKTFEGGVQGTGQLSLTYSSGSGKLIFGIATANATLGSVGNLILNVPTNKLELKSISVPASAIVSIESNDTGNPNTIERSVGNLNINGVLDITDLRITNSNSTGGIIVNNNGTLRTRFSAGNGGLWGSGSAIPSGNLTLNNGSTIEYYGENQQISNLNYYHLKLSGTGTKTPQSLTNINTDGSVSITGTTIVDYSSTNLASSGMNNTAFNMDGGRLILGTSGTQPNMRGDYNITGGVVEFKNNGATAQTIRSNSSDSTGKKYKYQNIEVTGTNVGTSGGNIGLKPNGTFIVKENGIFRIRMNSIRCFDSDNQGSGDGTNCSVTVEKNAVFQTGNDKGFSGFNSSEFADNNSSVHANIQNINLQNGSTVEYLGDATGEKTQDISTQTGVGQGTNGNYYNLKISGPKINPFVGILRVNNMTEIGSAGKLRIESTDDSSGDSNIVYALKGINVVSGGDLTFGSNAQLMQDTDADNTGNVNIERQFVFSAERKQYNFLSSPVINPTRNIKTTIYDPNPLSVQQYNEADYYFYETLGEYISGKGYAVRESPGTTDQIGRFLGTPFNDQLSYVIKKTNSGFNLVGNPYPSNMDIEKLYNDNKTIIMPTIYFWDNRGNEEFIQQGYLYNGDHYAKYNAYDHTSTKAATPTTYEVRLPTKMVKSTTGFMIQVLNTQPNGEYDLIFNNYQRSTDAGPGFFGKTSNFEPENQMDRYWLTMTTPGEISVMNAVVYLENGSDEFWIDDTESFGSSDDLYTIIDQKQLSIQGKRPFRETDQIPLGYRAFHNGTHIISVYDKEGVFENEQDIYLIDHLLNIVHNLSEKPYKFMTRKGEFNQRFTIVYKPGSENGSEEFTNKNQIEFVKNENQLLIRSSTERISEVEIFDLNNQSILKKSNVNLNEITIDALSFKNQVVVISVLTDKDERVNRKFVN